MHVSNFAEKYRKWILAFLTIIGAFITLGIIICVWILLFSTPVSGEIFIYGSEYNYSVNVLPNNSYVHQGENISQGSFYDLTGVYGWSGYLAMWKHEEDVGYIMPDAYINFNTGPAPRHYYIDPATMPVGDWYQIDKFTFGKDSNDIQSISFGQNNALAFHVVSGQFATDAGGNPIATPQVGTTMVVHQDVITQYNGTGIEHIPVTYTQLETVTPESSFVPAGDVVVITVNPTTIPTEGVAATPTAKEASLLPAVPILAFLGVIVWRSRN
jgi:hypothetical protein